MTDMNKIIKRLFWMRIKTEEEQREDRKKQ